MDRRTDQAARFVVRGQRRNGRVTYLCASPEWALRKLKDFARAGYAEISVTGPDGQPVDEEALAALADGVEEPAATAP